MPIKGNRAPSESLPQELPKLPEPKIKTKQALLEWPQLSKPKEFTLAIGFERMQQWLDRRDDATMHKKIPITRRLQFGLKFNK